MPSASLPRVGGNSINLSYNIFDRVSKTAYISKFLQLCVLFRLLFINFLMDFTFSAFEDFNK